MVRRVLLGHVATKSLEVLLCDVEVIILCRISKYVFLGGLEVTFFDSEMISFR